MQLAGFGVHQVGGKLSGVAAEERIRQGHVAPVEAQEVQTHEEESECVDETCRRILAHRQGEKRAVWQRELQVLGDEGGIEFLPVGALAARDDGYGVDRWGIEAGEVAQAVVLMVGDCRPDFLDGEHASGQVHEAHDMAGNAAGKRSE